MSQELNFTGRFKFDPNDLTSAAQQLNKVQQAAQTPAGGQGSAAKAEKDAVKELSITLDQLASAYERNADLLTGLMAQKSEYRQQLNELAKAQKSESGLTEEQARQQAALGTALKDVNGDIAEIQKQLISNQHQYEAKIGSYKAIELAAKNLRAEIQQMAVASKEEQATLENKQQHYRYLVRLMRKFESGMRVSRDEVANAAGSYNALKEEAKSLADQIRATGGVFDENSEQVSGLQQQHAEIVQQLREFDKAMRGAAQGSTAAEGSYREVQERMKELSVEIRNTGDAWGANKQRVGELQKEYLQLNMKLKEFDGSMGNFQRNVGDYENAIRSAANAVAVFQGPLGPIAGRINSFATVLTRSIGVMNSFTGATMTASKALAAFIAMSGIGLIVIALAGLVNLFRGTARGAEQLRVVMAALGGVISHLRDRSIAVGRVVMPLFRAFSQGALAVADFATAVANAVSRLNPFKKSVEDADAALGAKNRTLRENIELAAELQRRENELLRTERALAMQRAVMLTTMQATRDAARDLTLTIDERRTALEAEIEAQERLMHLESMALRQRISLEQERLAQFESGEQETKDFEELVRSLLDMERDFYVRRMSLRRDANTEDRRERERDARRRRSELEVQQTMQQAAFDRRIAELRRFGHREQALRAQMGQVAVGAEERILTRMADLQDRFEDAAQARRMAEREEAARQGQEMARLRTELDQLRYDAALALETTIADLRITQTRRVADGLIATARFRFDEITALDLEEEAVKIGAAERIERRTRELYLQIGDQAEAARLAEREEAERASAEIERITQRRLEFERRVSEMRDQLQEEQRIMDSTVEGDLELIELRRVNDEVAALMLEKEMIMIGSEERIAREARELHRQGLSEAEARELASAKERTRIKLAEAQADARIEQVRLQHRRQMEDAAVAGFFSAAEALFGSNKELQAAQVAIESIRGAQRAIATLPPLVGKVQAAAIIASGAASIRRIYSTNLGTKSVQAAPAVNVAEGFQFVDTRDNEARSLISETSPRPGTGEQVIIQLETFDDGQLARKVRDGNRKLDSRGITIRS